MANVDTLPRSGRLGIQAKTMRAPSASGYGEEDRKNSVPVG